MLYTIIAIVSKINIKAKTVELKGVGKYQFLDDKNKALNVMCADKAVDFKIIDPTAKFILPENCFCRIVLANAMANQKPLLFEVEEQTGNPSWTITSISIPNV